MTSGIQTRRDEMSETAVAVETQRLYEGLGCHPDAIASTLANKGVTGRRGSASLCPLTAYLRTQGIHASVGQHYTVARSGTVSSLIDHDVALSMFVCRFDQGWYPELADAGWVGADS